MLVEFRRQWPILALLGAIAGFFSGVVLAAQAPEGTGGTMTPAPDAEAAVQSEYDGATRKGTREAYERFIRRHPDHPLAQKARDVLAAGTLK